MCGIAKHPEGFHVVDQLILVFYVTCAQFFVIWLQAPRLSHLLALVPATQRDERLREKKGVFVTAEEVGGQISLYPLAHLSGEGKEMSPFWADQLVASMQ